MHEHHAMHEGVDHPASHHPQSADKCSVCASCCAGLGMAATVPQWLLPSQEHAALVATFKLLLPSFLPEGLERPPRPFLA